MATGEAPWWVEVRRDRRGYSIVEYGLLVYVEVLVVLPVCGRLEYLKYARLGEVVVYYPY
jgi:hypothetical protein